MSSFPKQLIAIASPSCFTFVQILFMHFPSPVSVQWLAGLLHAELLGNKDGLATGINELHKVEKGDLAFVDHPKYYAPCIHSAADFIIINTNTEAVPDGKAFLVVDQPFEAYLKIVRHFRPFEKASQLISASAQVAEGTYIAPNAFIGNHVTIGKNCIVQPNVSILDHSVIGDNVYIQAGTVIGSDAFYYNLNGIPMWQNSLLVVTLKNGNSTDQQLYSVQLNENGTSVLPSDFSYQNPREWFATDQKANGRLRDLTFDAEGKKLFLINNGGADRDKITVYTYHNSNLLVFPNPVRDWLNFDCNEKIKQTEIINVTGDKIKSFEGMLTHIQTADLASGVYFLRVKTETNHTIQTKFIKY